MEEHRFGGSTSSLPTYARSKRTPFDRTPPPLKVSTPPGRGGVVDRGLRAATSRSESCLTRSPTQNKHVRIESPNHIESPRRTKLAKRMDVSSSTQSLETGKRVGGGGGDGDANKKGSKRGLSKTRKGEKKGKKTTTRNSKGADESKEPPAEKKLAAMNYKQAPAAGPAAVRGEPSTKGLSSLQQAMKKGNNNSSSNNKPTKASPSNVRFAKSSENKPTKSNENEPTKRKSNDTEQPPKPSLSNKPKTVLRNETPSPKNNPPKLASPKNNESPKLSPRNESPKPSACSNIEPPSCNDSPKPPPRTVVPQKKSPDNVPEKLPSTTTNDDPAVQTRDFFKPPETIQENNSAEEKASATQQEKISPAMKCIPPSRRPPRVKISKEAKKKRRGIRRRDSLREVDAMTQAFVPSYAKQLKASAHSKSPVRNTQQAETAKQQNSDGAVVVVVAAAKTDKIKDEQTAKPPLPPASPELNPLRRLERDLSNQVLATPRSSFRNLLVDWDSYHHASSPQERAICLERELQTIKGMLERRRKGGSSQAPSSPSEAALSAQEESPTGVRDFGRLGAAGVEGINATVQ